MSIVSVKQIAAGRSGDASSDFNRSYTVVWLVIVDDPYDGPLTVGTAAGLPTTFDKYVGYENSSDLQALCTGIKPEQDGSEWQKWKVTATFETNFTDEQNQPQENPELDPMKRWVEVEFEKKKVTKEYDGTDIRNSAGQLIAGLEKDNAVGVYCFERNELSISPYIVSHNNAVNSDNFYGLTSGQGLMRITAGQPQYRNGIQFYKHSYRVRINPDGWEVNPADKGTRVKGSDDKLVKPKDIHNQPLDGEVFLDGNGKKLGEGEDIVYIGNKKLYRPQPFAILQL